MKLGFFAGLGLTSGGHRGAVALVAGVFSGSAAWWLALTGLVGLFRQRLGVHGMVWINRLSGLVIAGFGLAALLALG